MECVACGNGLMQERETGAMFVAECGTCGARISAMLETPDFATVDRNYEREFVLV